MSCAAAQNRRSIRPPSPVHHPTVRVPLACLAAGCKACRACHASASLSRCPADCCSLHRCISIKQESPSPDGVAAIVGFVLSTHPSENWQPRLRNLSQVHSRQVDSTLNTTSEALPAQQLQVRAALSHQPLATPFAGPRRAKQGQWLPAFVTLRDRWRAR